MLWATEKERTLLSGLRDQSALAVEISKAQLAGGTGTAAAALATRADLEELDNKLDAADADVAAARATLQRWLGPAADRPLGGHPDFSTLRVPQARLDAEVDRLGPLLHWGPLESKAEAAVALARAGKHPNWSVSLMYGSRIHLPDMVGVEVGMSLPLFPGNRQDRNISARVADRAAIRAQREDAIRAEREAIGQAVAAWQSWTRQVTRYRTQLLPLAADRSRAALAAYQGGGALQPWLNARGAEIATRVAYAKVLAAWGKAWVALAYLLPDQNIVELPQ
jgi:outer membrane protein TolC